jgi:hypothetical protein
MRLASTKSNPALRYGVLIAINIASGCNVTMPGVSALFGYFGGYFNNQVSLNFCRHGTPRSFHSITRVPTNDCRRRY